MNNPTYYDSVTGAEILDLQTCVVQYRVSKNEHLLRVILFKLRGTFNFYLYSKTNYPDKSELLALYEDKLLECIENFDDSKNVKFITYFSRCLDNALINFINSHRNNDLSLDYEYEGDESDYTFYQSTLTTTDDEQVEDIESLMLLDSIKDKLDSNEYEVCRILLSEHHKLKYWEIADQMGLTIAAIPNILKRLRKKFRSGMFQEKLLNSL
jgi:RNA polymerase sporulation-specific sigma factor